MTLHPRAQAQVGSGLGLKRPERRRRRWRLWFCRWIIEESCPLGMRRAISQPPSKPVHPRNRESFVSMESFFRSTRAVWGWGGVGSRVAFVGGPEGPINTRSILDRAFRLSHKSRLQLPPLSIAAFCNCISSGLPALPQEQTSTAGVGHCCFLQSPGFGPSGPPTTAGFRRPCCDDASRVVSRAPSRGPWRRRACRALVCLWPARFRV